MHKSCNIVGNRLHELLIIKYQSATIHGKRWESKL